MDAKHVQRVQAVLDLFRGDAVAEVSARYGIRRSGLYKFRRRALAAISEALADRGRDHAARIIASLPTAKRR
jgi:hypothetical protein